MPLTNIIIMALITKVNNPKVKIFIGRVNKINTGFNEILMIASKTATTKADKKSFRKTPGKM